MKYKRFTDDNMFVTSRRAIPSAPGIGSSKKISDERKAELGYQINRGEFKEGFSGDVPLAQSSMSPQYVKGIRRFAGIGTTNDTGEMGSSNAWSGSGGTVRQGPEIYSPLWLTSNTHLPRDRGTMNAWTRAFFALNPVVNNAVSLHSTYPISKLNITCPNKQVENFFNTMSEEMDLLNVCVQIAQEFYVIGEAFPQLELNVATRKWIRCIIQNPDYIWINKTAIPGEPEISIRPDAEIRRVLQQNDPESRKVRASLPPEVIKYIRAGKNIPLDNFYISHLARKISPYETRGTSIIAPCFKALMLWDKLRECKYAQADNLINPITLIKLGGSADSEFKVSDADLAAWRELMECHDEETEVLTDKGFKKFYEVIDYDADDMSQNVKCSVKENIKIACFNPNNEELEYHIPERACLYNRDGEMYHFKNEKIDIKVTPNHKMWLKKNRKITINGKRKVIWKDWEKLEAKDINLNSYNKFRTKINWRGNDSIKTISIIGKEVPIELYLEFLGYLVSEGHLVNSSYHWNVGISQSINKYYKKMKACMDKMSECLGLSYTEHIDNGSKRKEGYSDCWTARFNNKELFEHFKSEVKGANGGIKSYDKKLPRWIMELSPRLLKILLNALIDGDGSVWNNPNKTSQGFAYFTTSKELSDDVYELVYKCGFSPTIHLNNREGDQHLINNKYYKVRSIYIVLWSTAVNGDFPLVYKTSINSKTKEKHQLLNIENYKGKVWCFTVPTGLFVTRRNNKITVQGNSAQYDKDFKIITHGSVTIERIGAQTVIDINADLERLIKEIYIGLMVPQVIMEAGDITYANGSLSLDVLRQRYMQFQNMLSKWIKTKVFAPIAQLNDFWEYEDGEKKLIIPNVEWNHMNLFDLSDYIQQISQLVGERKIVSVHTLYRSLGLDYEDEQRKIRKENIDDAIHKKEVEMLGKLSLAQLKSLNDEDEIPDLPDYPVPGESPEETPAAGGGEAGGGGMESMMGGGGGGMPPPPPAGGAEPPA